MVQWCSRYKRGYITLNVETGRFSIFTDEYLQTKITWGGQYYITSNLWFANGLF